MSQEVELQNTTFSLCRLDSLSLLYTGSLYTVARDVSALQDIASQSRFMSGQTCSSRGPNFRSYAYDSF